MKFQSNDVTMIDPCRHSTTRWAPFVTDNNPLTYVLTSAKLDATGHRWASALGEYSFDIFYRPGLKNTDADTMSRYPFEKYDKGLVEVNQDTIKAVCNSVQLPYIETLPACTIDIVEATEMPGQSLALKELREVRKLQRTDPLIERWRKAVIDKTIPRQVLSSDDLTMKKQFKNFIMKWGLLFRIVKEEDREIEQLVIPSGARDEVLKSLHDDVGHPGKERTLRLLRERFYWPSMTNSVDRWVGKCNRCLRRKSSTNQRAPLVNVTTTYPLELVCFDYLTLEPSKGGIANILVITDHFTKYAMAIPTRNQTARTTAEAFYNNFVVKFGIPSRLHSDQGANFESDIVKELCFLTDMKKSHTTPYHPQGNAGPERFNRTLLDMLGTLEPNQKEDWKKYVNSLVYFYNCTPHESTKFSPFELMFGRKPKLPVDVEYSSVRDEPKTRTTREYIEDLRDRIETTREIVEKHVGSAKKKQKHQYDKRAKAVELSIGDRVLVKIVSFEGKHKIADRFEESNYRIIDRPRNDIPVYRVRSETTGLDKTLHRNLLFKVEGGDDLEEIGETEAVEEKSTETDGMYIGDKNKEDVNHDVMAREESDDESTCVGTTQWHGDAHNLIMETPDETAVVPDEEQDDSLADEEENGKDEDQKSEEVEEDEELEAVNEEHSHEELDVSVQEERPDQEEVTDEIDRAVDDASGEENKPDKIHKQDKDQPVPAPRRSTRQRKPPDRFGDYVAKTMCPRPFDTKIQALEELMRSGVLHSVDTDTAQKLIDTIMH